MEYHIYPSFHEECAHRIEIILRNLVQNFSQELKIWRFQNFKLDQDKKTFLQSLKALKESKMFLCFLTKNYIESDEFKVDFILGETTKKPILILVLDEISDTQLERLQINNPDIRILDVYKEISFFESGCFRSFIKFIEDTDRILEIYRYNAPNSLYSCIPVYHFKCRFDQNDKNCTTNVYTRTTNVFRSFVPINKIDWNTKYLFYKPFNFTSDKVKDRKPGSYKDPDTDSSEFSEMKFNKIDEKYNCDRRSHHGNYLLEFNETFEIKVPRNPVGRTGLIGRGHLGKWGPNHAADPIVTRWRKDERNQIVRDNVTNKPILQFVSIRRRDTKQWAIPGGMRDPGEIIHNTLIREFAEEALSKDLQFDQKTGIISKNEAEEILKQFFSKGIQIYKGYVDDPRNTDNAWMETVVYNFHDEKNEFVGNLNLQSGSDAEKVQWVDLNSNLQLYASHADFLYEVAVIHRAHW